MRSRHKFQYTIRDVPPELDRVLRETARRRGLSLNRAVVDMLRREAGQAGQALYDDLDGFFGSWVADEQVDRALKEQRRIEPNLWK